MATLAAPPPSPSPARRSPYSRVSIALHWVIALLILGNLGGGLAFDWMISQADPAIKQAAFQGIQVHKAAGLTILMLSLVRLGNRMVEGFPPLPAHMKGWEVALARVTHYGFYGLMIGMPLMGWLMVSSSPLNIPTSYFGLFIWPHLPTGVNTGLAKLAGSLHAAGGWAFVALLALHVAGALKHHFIDRDNVLARMIPLLRRRA